MPDYFATHRASLVLSPLGAPNTGFRPGQLGALHSVVAHFSVYEEPAIVSLPTGYGKTAVMMALPFVLGAKRMLVVEPSDALRHQTTGHIAALSTLRKLKAVDDALPNPATHGQKGRPVSAAEWAALDAYDVVISTPASTSPLSEPISSPDLFDLVIFDEAHHAPAATWAAYQKHYGAARFIFLTATPFRRDKKTIPGRLAYSYPVSRASREDAFGRVRFSPANVRNDHDDDEIDRAIVRAAIDQLRKDRAAGFDHRIFARAASIKAAQPLAELYKADGSKVEAIASHVSKRRQDEIEAALLSGELDGIVCVDMFGEGYDFPKLKIAALHAPHRSLVPTIQFIGRFARTTDVSTGDATVIAATSRLRSAASRLYEEGVDIASLIDAAAKEQLADGAAASEILDILETKIQAESDYDAVSPLSLELYAHAQIFECAAAPDFDKFGSDVGRKLKLAKQWISKDRKITLLLTVDHEPPNWATSDVLVNVRHDVFLLAYNAATRLCYIGSTRRTSRLYLALMQAVCADQHRPISYEATRRAMAGLSDLRFYNVGLKNTAINSQAETYRVLTGPRAEKAVTTGDGRSYVQGHFFGSGVNGGGRETIGASSSSRVWSNQRLSVADYLRWITTLNARLNGRSDIAESQLDLIQHSRSLKKLPPAVIGGSWPKLAYRHCPRVRYRLSGEANWRFKQITDLELANFVVTGRQLSFSVEGDDVEIAFLFSLDGGQMIRTANGDAEIEISSRQDDWIELASWLSMHPPAFYGSDKSSFQGTNSFPPPSTTSPKLAEGDSEAIDWTGCAIQVEFEAAKAGKLQTVHAFLCDRLKQTPGLELLVYDHRSGEAADYIAITREPDERVRVALYHCKGAGGPPNGKRVSDVYEVTCQVLKSVTYCDAEILGQHLEHRTNAGRHKNPSVFVVGDLETAKSLLGTSPEKLDFAVIGVQPGISRSAIDSHLADLMAFSLDYVLRGGAAKGAWMINA